MIGIQEFEVFIHDFTKFVRNFELNAKVVWILVPQLVDTSTTTCTSSRLLCVPVLGLNPISFCSLFQLFHSEEILKKFDIVGNGYHYVTTHSNYYYFDTIFKMYILVFYLA